MKGLIVKDFYHLASNRRIYLTLVLMFLFIVAFNENALSMLAVYLPVICLTLCISTFSYDDYSKWDRYALALPLDRKTVVRARYLFALSLLGIAMVLSLVLCFSVSAVLQLSISSDVILSTAIGSAASVCVMICLLFPILYRYGAEKGRIMMFVIVFGIIGLSFAGKWLFEQSGGDIVLSASLMNLLEQYLIWGLLFLALVAIVVSYRISIAVYQKKEF